MNPLLDLSRRLTVLPVVHGSADFALQVTRFLTEHPYDCLAVPLPPAFAAPVEDGVELLPRVSVVVHCEPGPVGGCSIVPLDPCQAVVAAIRQALADGVRRAWVDLEVERFEALSHPLPDPFALKEVSLERFAAALVPFMPAPPPGSQREARLLRMAYELHRLELEHEHVVALCSVLDWPWLRDAYRRRRPYAAHERPAEMPERRDVSAGSLVFLLGELPFVTALYEHRRAELVSADSLGVDGLKALLLEARAEWARRAGSQPARVAPKLLGTLLTYARNLSLLDNRLTPDLYSLVLAGKQVVGDGFALALVATAQRYPPQRVGRGDRPVRVGPAALLDPTGEQRPYRSRLEGAPRVWRRLPLRLEAPPAARRSWALRWNPLGQCSYPPEDERIECFQRHVRQQARLLIGDTEARTERFAASLKDGLDLRESLRQWHRGELYVRELPATRGDLEVVVFIFDLAAAADRYPWQATWYAEHDQESTLCFFATDYLADMVGPGIGRATYGGCFFLYPPRPVPDVWQDRRVRPEWGLATRLVAGALLNSQERRVALVAPEPPPLAWRRLARQLGRQLVHLPLQRFSVQTVERLRSFHVLNGRLARTWAARFIRDLR